MSHIQKIVFLPCIVFPLIICAANQQYKTNVLLIMFDDMRPLFHAAGERHMITPNIDFLASKSVMFENANCQVAVCSPSRSSMMTGLRPDTIASYGFSNSWTRYVTFPKHFSSMGYNIANYGKIYHRYDFEDKLNISYGLNRSRWYGYQGSEQDNLNSTVNPDRNTPETEFRDYIYTTKAIEGLRKLTSLDPYFLVGIGFKLPHTQLHFPYKYFEMYRDRKHVWEAATPKNLHFPRSAPAISYRCCAYGRYVYMKDEGNSPSTEILQTPRNITGVIPHRMHVELMWAYSASITYLDTQIGRLLDAITELKLWNNITIVFTSDHGMHNGEKGIWYSALLHSTHHMP
jgi:iduronate 2-sulfatase